MENQKLIKTMSIGLAEDLQTCGISISPDMDCATAFQLIGTLALHTLEAFREVATSELDAADSTDKERKAAITGITESMYDAMDTVFSNVLQSFYPNAPRTSIEDEAILRLTNQLIEQRYNQLSEKEKSNYRQAYNKAKLQMGFRAATTKQQNTVESVESVESVDSVDNANS